MSMELLLIAVVALLVFGPEKLPMLVKHFMQIQKILEQVRAQWHAMGSRIAQETALRERKAKAEAADAVYQKSSPNPKSSYRKD